MSIFRRRPDDLETLLRGSRPQPRDDFVAGLAAHVERRTPARGGLGRRLALVAAVTAAIAAVFGAFGGLGYAASAAAHAVTSAKPVRAVFELTPSRSLQSSKEHGKNDDKDGQKDERGKGGKDDDDNPSHDQYKPGKGCGDKNHVHARENECKKLK